MQIFLHDCRKRYCCALLSLFFMMSGSAQAQITRAEYYIDTDPGYGLAQTINLGAASNNISASFNINTAALSIGLHIVGVRSRDANGLWSFDERWLLFKREAPQNPSAITRLEYYIDTDPGYGNATAVSVPLMSDVTTSFNINNVSLPKGLHIIGVRSRDADGRWSFDERWLLFKREDAASLSPVVRVEYYIDADPGYSNGIPLAFLPSVNIANISAFINVTGLSSGVHKLFIRSRDSANVWSLDDTLRFTINNPLPAPSIVVNSLEFAPICEGATFRIGYHATGTYNAGNNFIAEISDLNGSFASPTQVGSVESTTSGLINCILPVQAQKVSAYKLRVRSTYPVVSELTTVQNLTVNQHSLGKDTFAVVVCSNQTADITRLLSIPDNSLTWSITNPTAAPLGIYSAFIISTQGCEGSIKITVKQNLVKWTGTVSTDWHTAANWSTGNVPDANSHVVIPAGVPRNCVISQADGIAASVQVLNDATPLQIINDRKLMVNGNCISLPPGD